MAAAPPPPPAPLVLSIDYDSNDDTAPQHTKPSRDRVRELPDRRRARALSVAAVLNDELHNGSARDRVLGVRQFCEGTRLSIEDGNMRTRWSGASERQRRSTSTGPRARAGGKRREESTGSSVRAYEQRQQQQRQRHVPDGKGTVTSPPLPPLPPAQRLRVASAGTQHVRRTSAGSTSAAARPGTRQRSKSTSAGPGTGPGTGGTQLLLLPPGELRKPLPPLPPLFVPPPPSAQASTSTGGGRNTLLARPVPESPLGNAWSGEHYWKPQFSPDTSFTEEDGEGEGEGEGGDGGDGDGDGNNDDDDAATEPDVDERAELECGLTDPVRRVVHAAVHEEVVEATARLAVERADSSPEGRGRGRGPGRDARSNVVNARLLRAAAALRVLQARNEHFAIHHGFPAPAEVAAVRDALGEEERRILVEHSVARGDELADWATWLCVEEEEGRVVAFSTPLDYAREELGGVWAKRRKAVGVGELAMGIVFAGRMFEEAVGQLDGVGGIEEEEGEDEEGEDDGEDEELVEYGRWLKSVQEELSRVDVGAGLQTAVDDDNTRIRGRGGEGEAIEMREVQQGAGQGTGIVGAVMARRWSSRKRRARGIKGVAPSGGDLKAWAEELKALREADEVQEGGDEEDEDDDDDEYPGDEE